MRPVSLKGPDTWLDIAAGMLLGFFSWMGYRELSIIDPFSGTGLSGLWTFAIAGGLLYRTSARGLVWTIAGSIAFMILIVSQTPIIKSGAQSLIRTDSVGAIDAVVVLSSSVSDDELLDQQAVDRLLTGLETAKKYSAKSLIVTPVTMQGADRTVSTAADQLRLFQLSNASVELITTGPVVNTHDEAMQTAAVARQRGWKRVALVTSPLHSSRACAAFEKQGLAVTCVPAKSRDLAVGTLKGGADRLRAFQLWLYETLAISEYRRRGWI